VVDHYYLNRTALRLKPQAELFANGGAHFHLVVDSIEILQRNDQ